MGLGNHSSGANPPPPPPPSRHQSAALTQAAAGRSTTATQRTRPKISISPDKPLPPLPPHLSPTAHTFAAGPTSELDQDKRRKRKSDESSGSNDTIIRTPLSSIHPGGWPSAYDGSGRERLGGGSHDTIQGARGDRGMLEVARAGSAAEDRGMGDHIRISNALPSNSPLASQVPARPRVFYGDRTSIPPLPPFVPITPTHEPSTDTSDPLLPPDQPHGLPQHPSIGGNISSTGASWNRLHTICWNMCQASSEQALKDQIVEIRREIHTIGKRAIYGPRLDLRGEMSLKKIRIPTPAATALSTSEDPVNSSMEEEADSGATASHEATGKVGTGNMTTTQMAGGTETNAAADGKQDVRWRLKSFEETTIQVILNELKLAAHVQPDLLAATSSENDSEIRTPDFGVWCSSVDPDHSSSRQSSNPSSATRSQTRASSVTSSRRTSASSRGSSSRRGSTPSSTSHNSVIAEPTDGARNKRARNTELPIHFTLLILEVKWRKSFDALCQTIAYLLTANEVCLTPVAMVLASDRFSRIFSFSGNTPHVAIEVSPSYSTHYGQIVDLWSLYSPSGSGKYLAHGLNDNRQRMLSAGEDPVPNMTNFGRFVSVIRCMLIAGAGMEVGDYPSKQDDDSEGRWDNPLFEAGGSTGFGRKAGQKEQSSPGQAFARKARAIIQKFVDAESAVLPSSSPPTASTSRATAPQEAGVKGDPSVLDLVFHLEDDRNVVPDANGHLSQVRIAVGAASSTLSPVPTQPLLNELVATPAATFDPISASVSGTVTSVSSDAIRQQHIMIAGAREGKIRKQVNKLYPDVFPDKEPKAKDKKGKGKKKDHGRKDDDDDDQDGDDGAQGGQGGVAGAKGGDHGQGDQRGDQDHGGPNDGPGSSRPHHDQGSGSGSGSAAQDAEGQTVSSVSLCRASLADLEKATAWAEIRSKILRTTSESTCPAVLSLAKRLDTMEQNALPVLREADLSADADESQETEAGEDDHDQDDDGCSSSAASGETPDHRDVMRPSLALIALRLAGLRVTLISPETADGIMAELHTAASAAGHETRKAESRTGNMRQGLQRWPPGPGRGVRAEENYSRVHEGGDDGNPNYSLEIPAKNTLSANW